EGRRDVGVMRGRECPRVGERLPDLVVDAADRLSEPAMRNELGETFYSVVVRLELRSGPVGNLYDRHCSNMTFNRSSSCAHAASTMRGTSKPLRNVSASSGSMPSSKLGSIA